MKHSAHVFINLHSLCIKLFHSISYFLVLFSLQSMLRTYSLTQQFTCLCPREFVAYDCQDSCRAAGTHRRHLCSEPGALARLTLIHIYIGSGHQKQPTMLLNIFQRTANEEYFLLSPCTTWWCGGGTQKMSP